MTDEIVQDAMRYRWLREYALLVEFVAGQDKHSVTVFSYYHGDNRPLLDSAIDSQRGKIAYVD